MFGIYFRQCERIWGATALLGGLALRFGPAFDVVDTRKRWYRVASLSR
jgi:hypothetical protein